MQARDVLVAAGLLVTVPWFACAQSPVPSIPFEKLAAECAPGVHPTTLKGVVSTESAGNPYAIGIVGGRLERQPRNLTEAVATARELERQGFNFSMGLGQVNRHNLAKYGESYETVFEPCRNLKAGSAILKDCYQRARARIPDDQLALRAAFSCYYSGNFTRGFRPDRVGQRSYVQKVVANATGIAEPIPIVPAVKPDNADTGIAVRRAGISRPAKRAATPAQWVIFADGRQQNGQAAEPPSADVDSEAVVKAELATPTDGAATAATSARRVAASAPHGTRPVSVERAPSSTTQPAAPFVQFVN